MRCAKCAAPMEETTLGPVRIDVCATCGGLWFDAGELRALLAMPDKDVKAALPPAAMRRRAPAMDLQNGACPRCQVVMQRVDSMATAEVLHHDRCPKCGGAWLDGGELEALCDEPTARAIVTFFADPDGGAPRG